jgi:hypothetical protein
MQIESEIKQLDALHSLLGELQKGLVRGTAAAAGFILVGIVWFASMKDAAPFLKEFPHFAWIAALAPVLGSLLYCYGAWLVHRRSQNIVVVLRRFDVMPSEIYENSIVSRNQFFIFSGGIVLLSLILGGCIYYTARSSSPDKDDNQDEVIMQVALRHTHETELLKQVAQYVTVRITNP